MYDESKYKFDKGGKSHEAEIENSAVLYRLTSIHFCQKGEILSGKAPVYSRCSGRFNQPDQLTTYCANNIIICLSEVLYHMYRLVLDGIRVRRAYTDVVRAMRWKKCLAIFKVNRIPNIIYIDCEGVRVDYDSRISGTTVVYPDPHYDPFHDFNELIRQHSIEGIFYPSARHSKNLCIALFGDKSNMIQNDFYELLNIELKLVPENQDPKQDPRDCDPFIEKLHPTMGYYYFDDAGKLEKIRDIGALYPKDIPPSGMIDFVRRRYLNYPHDAVLH